MLSEQFDDRIVIAVTIGINFEVDTVRDAILVHQRSLLILLQQKYIQRCWEIVMQSAPEHTH